MSRNACQQMKDDVFLTSQNNAFSLVSGSISKLSCHHRVPYVRVFRNMTVSSRLAIITILCSLSSMATAISLVDAIHTAVEHNPKYSSHQALRKVEAGYRQQADSLFAGDPVLNIAAATDSFGSDFGYEEYVAGVSLPMWLPGQKDVRRSIAENFGVQISAELSSLIWEVSGEVLGRAWKLRLAEAEVQQALKQWAASRALEKDINHRFEAGELTLNDLLLAQQDVVESEASYQEVVNNLQQAKLSWFNYTGLHRLPDDLLRYTKKQEKPELTAHPKLRGLLAQTQTFVAKVNDTRMQRRTAPIVSLYAKRDRGMRGEAYTDSLGIELSIPFGSRSQTAAAIAEAEVELTNVKAASALLKQQLELQIANAEQESSKAAHLLVLAGKKNDLAHKRLKLARRGFELGEMGLYQLLLAQQQASSAARDFEIKKLEKNYAIARENHLSGVIPQ